MRITPGESLSKFIGSWVSDLWLRRSPTPTSLSKSLQADLRILSACARFVARAIQCRLALSLRHLLRVTTMAEGVENGFVERGRGPGGTPSSVAWPVHDGESRGGVDTLAPGSSSFGTGVSSSHALA